MRPREFLACPQRLLQSSHEADRRSAVSRAYYGAFHVAVEMMQTFRFTVPYADRAHGYLWLRLQNCGNTLVEDAGRQLKDLRSIRNSADYYLARSFDQRTANAAVRQAEHIIQTLDAIVEPARTQIISGMKLYERNVLKDVTWHP